LLANYNGQRKLSSSLPALDPHKEMAQTLLGGRAETFVCCLALKPDVAQSTHAERNQISCSCPFREGPVASFSPSFPLVDGSIHFAVYSFRQKGLSFEL